MMWKSYLLLTTVAVLRAQNLQIRRKLNDENLSSSAHSDLINKNGYSKTFSPLYDLERVSFNPHHYNNFANHMMNRSPVPRPNFYNIERISGDDLACPRDTACPRDSQRLPKKKKEFQPNFFRADHGPSIPPPWNNQFSYHNQIVPLIYFPAVTKNGHVDFRAVEYLKRLKNALNENPLLSKNRTTGKLNEIKIDGLSVPRERPSTKADGKTAFSQISSNGNPSRRMVRSKEGEKISNDLNVKREKKFAEQTKNGHNFKVTN